MDATEIIGKISGILVLMSALPYAWRVFQGKIRPSVASWVLWSFIGLSLLLNYRSVGAGDNIWPAIFGLSNPLLITVLAVIRRGEKIKFTLLDYLCAVFCVSSMMLWWYWLGHKDLSAYALYIAILADACAAVPTAVWVLKNPDKDRPFMWLLFGLGYGLSMFAIEEHSLANYSLPAYMLAMSVAVSVPLVRYRIKRMIPLKEWV